MSREQDLFNCSEQHEHDYVAGLYKKEDRPAVRTFLEEKCLTNEIHNSTHAEVYALIKSELGLDRE